MHEYVNCNIVNGENEICNWRWIEDQNQFNISLTNIESTQTLHRHQSYGAGKYDVLGYIRCRIKDETHFRDIKFDLPFVVRHPNSTSYEAFSETMCNYMNPTLCLKWGIGIFTIVLSLLFVSIITVWNYTRRKKNISNAKKLIDINTMDDLSVIEKLDEEKILVLGAGTNVILSDYFDGTVIQVHLKDIEVHEDYISVGAGVDWAELIEYCLKNKLYGIENLTHIPGSVGAAPVQNIGAYGVEISSFIISIECFNLK